MWFTRFTLTLAAAHGALAAPSRPAARGFGCGAPDPDAEHIKISQAFAAQEAAFSASGNLTTQAVTTIDTYFPVVASSTSLSGGYLTVRPPQPPKHHFSYTYRLELTIN